jgi:large subunit ribosomal protein L18
MGKNKRRVILFRRKHAGNTDYKKRMKFLTSKEVRLVVRKSLHHITAQLVQYEAKGDKVLATVNSRQLKAYGWQYRGNNLAAAYLVGLLIGKQGLAIKIKKAILDIGRQKKVKGSKVFSVLKGALDAGMDIAHAESMLPSEERLQGKHIATYAEALKKNQDAYTKQFAFYVKHNIDPTQVATMFIAVKKKIIGE